MRTEIVPAIATAAVTPRRFEFDRDTVSFANELVWDYRFAADGSGLMIVRRDPRPTYTHRCFVLVRAARLFFAHARFDPTRPKEPAPFYRERVRQVLARKPWRVAPAGNRVEFPGYEGLRHFSSEHELLLKEQCGAAWRSYILRSHWRMVSPITRRYQDRTEARLRATLDAKGTTAVHLVRFPQLSINHGMLVYACTRTGNHTTFDAYDPNHPSQPAQLHFDPAQRTFRLPANAYWIGGNLDVIEIYRNWFF